MKILEHEQLGLEASLRNYPKQLEILKTKLQQNWQINQLNPADVNHFKRLFKKLHTYNASLDDRFALSEDWENFLDRTLEKALSSHEAFCLVARESNTGGVCGFVLASIHQDSGMWKHREWIEIEDLYVEEDWRGTGLADHLLEEVESWASRVGHSVVQLYVTSTNERALKFYRRQGFRQTQAIMRRVISN